MNIQAQHAAQEERTRRLGMLFTLISTLCVLVTKLSKWKFTLTFSAHMILDFYNTSTVISYQHKCNELATESA
jgi:hypothetical protein